MSKPSKSATKLQQEAAHRAKMMRKHFRNMEPGVGFYAEQAARGRKPRPNLSDNHPDLRYGIDGHNINKTKRRLKARLEARKDA